MYGFVEVLRTDHKVTLVVFDHDLSKKSFQLEIVQLILTCQILLSLLGRKSHYFM